MHTDCSGWGWGVGALAKLGGTSNKHQDSESLAIDSHKWNRLGSDRQEELQFLYYTSILITAVV